MQHYQITRMNQAASQVDIFVTARGAKGRFRLK